MFLRRTDQLSAVRPDHGDSRDAALAETVRSLQLSPAGVDRFFQRILDFCSSHNPERHYGHLVDLMNECVAAHHRLATTYA